MASWWDEGGETPFIFLSAVLCLGGAIFCDISSYFLPGLPSLPGHGGAGTGSHGVNKCMCDKKGSVTVIYIYKYSIYIYLYISISQMKRLNTPFQPTWDEDLNVV